MRLKNIWLFFLLTGTLSSCKKFLAKGPTSSITPDVAFSSSTDLQLFVNGFYNTMLPNADAIFGSDNSTGLALPTLYGGLGDNTVGAAPTYYLNGQFTSALESSVGNQWNWSNLRNVNYFLQNYNNPAIDSTDRANYSGIAHFFRAYFYYNMLKLYGDIPWYSQALQPSDTALYKPRDPRTLVADSILADINYACEYSPAATDPSCTQVTKWLAYALKSRICLFEGTFRKYHTELNLVSTAAQWLQQAAGAADTLIASGKYHLHTTGSPNSDYRALFINETPSNDEIMLAAVYSDALSKWNDANVYFTSSTAGVRLSFNHNFINTYLNADGSRFTDIPSFDTIEFQYEVQHRDPRLSQTIRMAPYTQDGTPAPPSFAYTYSGYQPLKFCQDNPALNSNSENNNAVSIFRYAEVLLNDAEAKEELGTLTTTDWNNTIGLIRARAGITNTAMPTVADPFLINNYYPDITDPVLLEIRRERGVELSLEGFRYDDIRRWKEGADLARTFTGLYVPAMNQLLDLNQDGKPDVCFVTKAPSNPVSGVFYFTIDNVTSKLSNGTSGTLLLQQNAPRTWADYKYYYPIPLTELQLNTNLVQNPGW
jgi:hypothetical protein